MTETRSSKKKRSEDQDITTVFAPPPSFTISNCEFNMYAYVWERMKDGMYQ